MPGPKSRRLAHVACTRAKRRLYLCHVRYHDSGGLRYNPIRAELCPFALPSGEGAAAVERKSFPVSARELQAQASAAAAAAAEAGGH